MNGNTFLRKVKDSLVSCGVDFEKLRRNNGSLGLGISGGADSVSLFLALKEILKEEKIQLVCVHVNHHIREKNETDGDMEFVTGLCHKAKEQGFDIKAEVFDLKENQVVLAEKERGAGIEDAARFVRYECFEKTIAKYGIGFFCLAHNLNDNLETILMRFLKGSGAGGIEDVRGKYIRPLLNITREEIENFLKSVGQNFRTDSTNLCDDYLRNNIRHNIVPVLEKTVPEWKEALKTGEENRRRDKVFLDNLASKTELGPELFEAGNEALASRVLIREINKIGVYERVPGAFIKDVILEIRKALEGGKDFSKKFSACECGVHKGEVFIKTFEKIQTDSGFFDIIEKSGIFKFPFGEITVITSENEGNDKNTVQVFFEGKCVTSGISFPFVIRSPQLGEKKQLFVVEGN
ncbi:MAG: tRNA lysidine(34) synthetase TilS [Treponema sp.]|nr:tRNA lysidine(34) synthetase TilS [Treponema sp.]